MTGSIPSELGSIPGLSEIGLGDYFVRLFNSRYIQ